MRQFDKTLEIRFPGSQIDVTGGIRYANDRGPRMLVETRRTMRAEPDTALVRVWNLPPDIATALAASSARMRKTVTDIQAIPEVPDEERAELLKAAVEDYQIEILAGWGGEAELVFRGDPIKVRPSVLDGQDRVTEIELGDAYVVLEQMQLLNQFAAGQTNAGLISWVLGMAQATGNKEDLIASVGQVAPNALVGRLANGFIAVGRPVDQLRTLSQLYGTQFWVKDGSVQMVARNRALRDYAVILDERGNLLSLSDADETLDRSFVAIASPRLHPGRGVVIRRLTGPEIKARIIEARLKLDTHGGSWEVSGVLSSADFAVEAVSLS